MALDALTYEDLWALVTCALRVLHHCFAVNALSDGPTGMAFPHTKESCGKLYRLVCSAACGLAEETMHCLTVISCRQTARKC